jgi:hypothetical protein
MIERHNLFGNKYEFQLPGLQINLMPRINDQRSSTGKYKFLVDNQWIEDLPGTGLVSDPFGTQNLVLWVEKGTSMVFRSQLFES